MNTIIVRAPAAIVVLRCAMKVPVRNQRPRSQHGASTRNVAPETGPHCGSMTHSFEATPNMNPYTPWDWNICRPIDPPKPPQLIGIYGSPMERLGNDRKNPGKSHENELQEKEIT